MLRQKLPSVSSHHPYTGHWLISSRVRRQIDCSKPLQKNLWKSIVQNKIFNQAKILEYFFPQHPRLARLKQLARETLSNDAKTMKAPPRQFISNLCSEKLCSRPLRQQCQYPAQLYLYRFAGHGGAFDCRQRIVALFGAETLHQIKSAAVGRRFNRAFPRHRRQNRV